MLIMKLLTGRSITCILHDGSKRLPAVSLIISIMANALKTLFSAGKLNNPAYSAFIILPFLT